jgi:sodium/proline symporter/sodium/pantothenate symporter
MTVLAVLLLLAAGIAWWGARRARSASDYFAAGQRAGAWLVGIAGTAAAVSAFTYVGGPALFLVAGAGSLWIILSAPLTGALQCWAVGERVVEMVHRHRVLTPTELIGARFSPGARAVAALVVVIGCVASGAVQAKAAAVLGEALLGVPGVLAAALAILATTLYTAAGGMRAGLLADAVQGGVMAAAALVLAGAALAAAGGPVAALATLERARPDLLGAFGRVPPARALAWCLLFCLGTLAQPHYIQKFFFLRSPAELRRLPAVLTGALAAMLAVWLGVGLAGAALVAQGRLSVPRPDDLTPAVMRLIGPWAMLLAGVAVLAALMSTAASFLNLAAAALTRDLPASLGRPVWGVGAGRAATVLVGAAAVVLGVQSERTIALLGVAGWGFFTAALLPVFTVGLAWERATGAGAVAAMLTGATVDLALESIRGQLPPGLEPGLAGAALGTLALVLVSVLPPASSNHDPRTTNHLPHALDR